MPRPTSMRPHRHHNRSDKPPSRIASLLLLVSALGWAACDEKATETTATTAGTSSASSTSSAAATPSASSPVPTSTGTGTGVGTGTDGQAGSETSTSTDTAADTGTESETSTGTGTAEAVATETATAATPTSTATAATDPLVEPPPPPPPSLPEPKKGSADAVAAAVDAIYLDHGIYRARFKQVHQQKVSGVRKESSGTVIVQRPRRISFRYDPPNQNRVVSDGTTLKVYVADDQQMLVTQVQKSEYPGALSFIMGQGMRPSFNFTFNEKAQFEGGPVLLGKPRAPTPHYETVLFYVDNDLLSKEQAGTIRRVLLLDAQGNRNRFDFSEASFPGSISPSEFEFTPPAGTNIVKR